MTNELKVADLLAEKTLFEFHAINTFLARDVYNNDCEEYFIYSQNGGYFPGNSVRFRLPNLYDTQEGYTVNFAPVIEETRTLTMGDPESVAVSFRSDEAVTAISLGDEAAGAWAERVAKPIATALNAKINRKIATAAETSVYNWVGDASSTITTSNVFYAASAMLSKLNVTIGVPYPGYAAIDSSVKTTLYPEVLKLFTPNLNENIFKKGVLGSIDNMDVMVEPAIRYHTSYAGTLGTPLVRTDSVSGDTVVHMKGFTPSITGIVKAGDLFTVTGAGGNPTPTKLARIGGDDTGMIFQFVATADADSDASGNVDVPVGPALVSDPTNPRRNISNIIHADDEVTFVGDYVCNLVWTQPAINFIAPPLAKLDKGAECSVKIDPDSRIAIRYSEQDNVSTSSHGRRMDIWPGIMWNPECACKIISKRVSF